MKKYTVRFEVIRSTATVVVAADSYEEAVAKARTAPPVFKVVPVAVAEDEVGSECQAVIGKCNWCGLELIIGDGATRVCYRDPDHPSMYICVGCAPESLVLFYKGS